MDERERLRRSWDVNASAWRDAVREGRIESRRVATDRAVVEAVLDQRPVRVLDLGCGEGWLCRALAGHGIATTGVDASAALIDAARAAGGGHFLVASYADLTADWGRLPTAPYDVVVANFSLLDDAVDEVLAAVVGALTAHGVLIVQTVHPLFAAGAAGYADGWRVETFDSFEGQWRAPMPWYFRTLGSWSAVLRGAGYAIAEIREPMRDDTPASILFICRRA